MPKPYWFGDALETLRRLAAEGKTLQEMADHFKKSASAVQAALYDHGVARPRERIRQPRSVHSQETLDAIRAGFIAGDSASTIAGRIGLTRNAVIGIRSRWMKDLVQRRPAAPVAKPPTTPRSRAMATEPLDESAFTCRARVASVLDLEDYHCRWPASGGFCGSRRRPGLPYCRDHAEVAYKSPSTNQNTSAATTARVDGRGVISR